MAEAKARAARAVTAADARGGARRMPSCGHREAQKGAGSSFGGLPPSAPPRVELPQGAEPFWSASPLHPRASSGFPNNTPPTLPARAGGVRGPAKWASRRERKELHGVGPHYM